LVGEYLANDQHPSHEISQGEMFIKELYEAVRASPLWNKTALVITYDEHGGFFDHVPTPLNIPNPDGKVSQDPSFDFTRIGIRVPTIVISPWVKKRALLFMHQMVLVNMSIPPLRQHSKKYTIYPLS